MKYIMDNIISKGESEENKEINNARTLSHKIYNILAYKIVNGEIKHGFRLIERELAEKYKISRTPIREALNKLAKDDLIELVPHKGGYVKGLYSKDINDIYNIRGALEKLAIRLSINDIPKQKIKYIKDLIEESKSKSGEERIHLLVNVDKVTHKLFLDNCNNERLVRIIENLWDIVNIYREMDAPLEGRAEKALKEHEKLLEAVENNDVELACRLMDIHIEESKKSILKHFRHLLY